jgi:hypothetical protein
MPHWPKIGPKGGPESALPAGNCKFTM